MLVFCEISSLRAYYHQQCLAKNPDGYCGHRGMRGAVQIRAVTAGGKGVVGPVRRVRRGSPLVSIVLEEDSARGRGKIQRACGAYRKPSLERGSGSPTVPFMRAHCGRSDV